ncbi:MAG: phytoene desaturase family protein [Silicimonas sp.]|nr:phytoene desaturase family protein [Silicimonas sp.]
MDRTKTEAVVIGAGMGGLSAALYLRALGLNVTVIEAMTHPGGKIRACPSAAGPVDAGPTVLTMLPVFRALFGLSGERMDRHLRLEEEPILARHFWPQGGRLDLYSDPDRSARAIETFAGSKAAREFEKFRAGAARLFEAFRAPMMEAARPSRAGVVAKILRAPQLIRDMAPHQSLEQMLTTRFTDPRLRQLFGRYATYVGATPHAAPALLALIWRAEEAGIWRVTGGMHRLAEALAGLAVRQGIVTRFGTAVADIETEDARATAVRLSDGTRIGADVVVFNGDPRALSSGRLGAGVCRAVRAGAVERRSLSAHVLACAARWTGPELAHHNVFFARDPRDEFGPIAGGQMPRDATLYLCAQDRGAAATPQAGTVERFEIIENAPPLAAEGDERGDPECLTRITRALCGFGAKMDPAPSQAELTGPRQFARMFPASLGAIYGQSPAGLTAAFKRPRARSRIRGLYLAGGGAHPGAGLPMAALSGRHAAEAIARDLGLTWRFHPTATPGGMSTGSPIAGAMPSRSSPS